MVARFLPGLPTGLGFTGAAAPWVALVRLAVQERLARTIHGPSDAFPCRRRPSVLPRRNQVLARRAHRIGQSLKDHAGVVRIGPNPIIYGLEDRLAHRHLRSLSAPRRAPIRYAYDVP